MSAARILRASDIAGAMRLKEAAGWNQTEADWRRILDLSPEGCFGIEQGGALAATATAICYGRDLAWIGMVLTDPAFRGRGLASLLMEHTLEFLNNRGVECVKLDATDMGRGLYRRFGFEDECAVERWMRPPGPARPVECAPHRFEDDLDRRAFGADRRELLAELCRIQASSVAGAGYAMGRPGSKAAYFGPCVATSRDAAARLLEWYLGRHSAEPIYWDLLPGNEDARDLAVRYGFEPVRRLVRMTRGASRRELGNGPEIYAIAGFEFG
ncbi:MAG TPA: GNAT family N-acetyltransferase [Bryobacteraceae bacterium]|nr:GNAT family N-acetyltransferase [Bryobacteraceae bacterium]